MQSKYKLPQTGGLQADTVPTDMLQRFEKIPTNIFECEYDGVQYVSNLIEEMVRRHCNENKLQPFVLGLSTGRTPIGLYRELVARYQAGRLDFSRVAVYSLDELYPIKANEQQSRNFRIHEDFLSHVNISPANIHIFDGTVPLDKVSDYCKKFESDLLNIDLMIMGMGEQGQIGFNEPGSYAKSRTRLVRLNHNTRKALLNIFHDYSQVPSMAITMGINTAMRAKRVILLAWGENKANIVRQIVEGDCTEMVPASLMQNHANAELVVDTNAAEQLTRVQTPWLVGKCEWTRKFMRKAVVWLCNVVQKPILKLTYGDYIENSLGQLLEAAGPYDKINIDIFNDLQHTITGWPGGKPNADDSTRPVPSHPFPKRVLIFSPHPDDDVISMGGTFIRLVEQGHDVHVAYETSGNVAVHDDVVVQMMDAIRELKIGDKYDYVRKMVTEKTTGEPDPIELREMKSAIRRSEARAAVRSFGMQDSHVHFLNLPFYETGGIQKGMLTQRDIDIVVNLLNDVQPHQIYAAGDLSDPHGTHRVCIEAVLEAMQVVRTQDWAKNAQIWLYRGAWQEWDLGSVDMAVPLSPEEVVKKRHAIYRHLSQKDIVPFPGDDTREFWQRAEDRTQHTAQLYNLLGMAEYQAIEVFVKI